MSPVAVSPVPVSAHSTSDLPGSGATPPSGIDALFASLLATTSVPQQATASRSASSISSFGSTIDFANGPGSTVNGGSVGSTTGSLGSNIDFVNGLGSSINGRGAGGSTTGSLGSNIDFVNG